LIFTLEALRAKHGDSLLLHYGAFAERRLVVIDGGPSGVFSKSLRPRLDELKLETEAESLPIRLLMVSHIDHDHIRGVLDLTRRLRNQEQEQKPLDYDIQTLWHNSFDDIVGNHIEAMFAEAKTGIGAAALEGNADPPPRVSRPAAMVLASVPEGRTLRSDADILGLGVNDPFDGLVTAQGRNEAPIELGDGLRFWVLGPSRQRVHEFQLEWDAELKRRELAAPHGIDAVAYLDKSVYNLASVVVLAEMEVTAGQTGRMLLTGDARGDDILAGLRETGFLLDGKSLHVDILKVPHHGSDRNVETDFFRKVTADHYVVSGDGKHGNPEVATFEMIFVARGNANFVLHLTYDPDEFIEDYPIGELTSLFDRKHAEGCPFRLETAKADGEVVRINLADPI